MCVCFCIVSPYILYIHTVNVRVYVRGMFLDAEAKGAVLAFVIIFNTVTQTESSLLKIPLRYL